MNDRFLTLSDDELAEVTAAASDPTILDKVIEIVRNIPHGHDSKRNVWQVYGASTIR